MYELFGIDEREKIEFIHFESVYACEIFIGRFGWTNIKRTCCSGKGFSFINTSANYRRILRLLVLENGRESQLVHNFTINIRPPNSIQEQEDSIIQTSISPLRKDMPTETECCVCLSNNNRFTSCMHNLCISCDTKLGIRICPICRFDL